MEFSADLDVNHLPAPPGNNHHVYKSLIVMDDYKVGGESRIPSGTVSWTADVYIYPTGASLSDIAYWKANGQVHIVVVHRGTIEHPDPSNLQSFAITTRIFNDGAQAKEQLPTSYSGVVSGDNTQYRINFSRRMPMYNGDTPLDFNASLEKTFTRSRCTQEAAVKKDQAESKMVPQSDAGARRQEIYGLSHFTLAAGDYEDIRFNFIFAHTASSGGWAESRVYGFTQVVKLHSIPGLSPSTEKQAAAAADFLKSDGLNLDISV